MDGTSTGRVWGTATLDEISAARNVNDVHGGMAGTAYAVFFVLSAVLATLFAAAVGALNVRIFRNSSSPSFKSGSGGCDDEPVDGLEALKQTDAFSTLTRSLRNLRRTGAADAREHMRSAHRWSIPSLIEEDATKLTLSTQNWCCGSTASWGHRQRSITWPESSRPTI